MFVRNYNVTRIVIHSFCIVVVIRAGGGGGGGGGRLGCHMSMVKFSGMYGM